jgi:phosphoglycerol transferase MdoB-like AlkP superfamily enzyme
LLLAALDLILTVITYSDILYYRQFRELPSVTALELLGEAWQVRSALKNLVQPLELIAFLSVPFFLLLAFLPGRISSRLAPGSLRSALFYSVLGILCLGISAYRSRGALQTHEYMGATWTARYLGFGVFHGTDIARYLSRKSASLKDREDAVNTARSWFAERERRLPSDTSTGSGAGARDWNVFVLQVESLQTFVIGASIDGQEITPNLNRLVGRSLYFPNTYTQIARGGTADASLMVNCSLYPTDPEIVYISYAANRFYCLPRIFRDRGYSATALEAVAPDFYNFAGAYRQMGYERFLSKWDFKHDREIGYVLSDGSMLRQSVEKLNQSKSPYFAFITTMTSHTPFEGPGLPHKLRLGKLEGTVLGGYLHAIHYVDSAIGEFVEGLERRGELAKTVLVFYGDHAGVHRGNSNLDQWLEIPSDDEARWQLLERNIPLISYTPDTTLAGRRDKVAGQIDIAPTLLDLLGFEDTGAPFMGRSLLASGEGLVSFANGSAVTDHHLYLSERVTVPPGCFARDSGIPDPLTSCSSARDETERALAISRSIIELDLIEKVRNYRN